VIVTINDRGPFVHGRVIDVSRAAAKELGMIGKGIASVRLEVVKPGQAKPQQVASVVPVVKEAKPETFVERFAALEPEDKPRNPKPEVPQPASLPADDARRYLVLTAHPGGTMSLQGSEKALSCLHPEFASNLAEAIRDARGKGLHEAGIFSACRPPRFGVGGFSDKFRSLHSYGLAVDMHGIGEAGSSRARQWHRIAAAHKVACPYGPDNGAEWNHCQGTATKVAPGFLRGLITSAGPKSLSALWAASEAILTTAKGAMVAVARERGHRRYAAQHRKHHRARRA
jgi:hypothetical protein